jgi:cell division protein FtsL
MEKKQMRKPSSRPIIRFRSMLLGTVVVAMLITIPLLMVWKQVYITSASLRMEKMTDSLSILSREMTTLRLRCEQLSSRDRIEDLAQKKLGLDYTPTDQIVIVKIHDEANVVFTGWPQELVAFLKKSLFGDRG